MKFLGRKTVKAEKTSAPKSSKAAKPSKTSPAATPAKAPTTTPTATTTPTRRAPTHEEIAARSYELYLARGGEAGHAEEDWLRAEAELS